MSADVVAMWDVSLSDGIFRIEFEHGTATGRRVIYINGKEVFRRDWMFRLVGKETFPVGSAGTKATINIEAITGFAYEYTLKIDGKSFQTFMANRSKTSKTWLLKLDGADCRIVLEKDTMNVWCNGQQMETTGDFGDDSTETHFAVGDHECFITASSSNKKRSGIIHSLLIDGTRVPEVME
ncbi:fas apoptotic inhibitory molecule b [Electrophorus electricus]|uniref:Fas apoptotic inhibitory molecule b n=1 Tax=Electrophorus electricus TaxID=8005 RepID=A0A4W4GQN7_ELEEL|nr:fas apoptotic inhibitory molecule b [Electrophorus electricus]